MKQILAIGVAAVLLLSPAAAFAKGPVYVPPNQSAASQYTEDVPTAGGNKPTAHIHPTGSSHSGGGSGGSTIPRSTLKAMAKHGSAGAAAATLAEALAPSKQASAGLAGGAEPTSASGQLVKTLTGSDAGSGIGTLLPIILIASLVAASGLGVMRFRSPGAAS